VVMFCLVLSVHFWAAQLDYQDGVFGLLCNMDLSAKEGLQPRLPHAERVHGATRGVALAGGGEVAMDTA
jgi:hypothetical protein